MITLTAGEQSENHVGMMKYGNGLAEHGFDLKDMKAMKKKFQNIGCECKLYCLNDGLDKEEAEKAYLLIIKNGVSALLQQTDMDVDVDDMFNEQKALSWDKKYYDTRRKKVLNKNARYNLCYGEEGRAPDYKNKQGRVVAYEDIPITQAVLGLFEEYFGKKAANLQLEGNYYYDVSKCGIGFHSDCERKIVIAMRLGADNDMYFRWYHNSKKIGHTMKFNVEGGDIYVMSEKATGFDGKKRSKPILRHATGAKKYTHPKK